MFVTTGDLKFLIREKWSVCKGPVRVITEKQLLKVWTQMSGREESESGYVGGRTSHECDPILRLTNHSDSHTPSRKTTTGQRGNSFSVPVQIPTPSTTVPSSKFSDHL